MKLLPAYRALARKYGLRFRVVQWYPQRAYNANGIFNIVTSRIDHAAHEIAHYLVATPAQRRLPEFGLGSTAFFTDVDVEEPPQGVPPRPATPQEMLDWDAQEIEGEASMLGIFIVRHVEGRDAAEDMYSRHTWDVVGALETTRDLLRKKLLTWHKGRLTPRCLVRPPKKGEIYAP